MHMYCSMVMSSCPFLTVEAEALCVEPQRLDRCSSQSCYSAFTAPAVWTLSAPLSLNVCFQRVCVYPPGLASSSRARVCICVCDRVCEKGRPEATPRSQLLPPLKPGSPRSSLRPFSFVKERQKKKRGQTSPSGSVCER